MDNIFVTVGIPLYNAEKFIRTAINSVLLQTYTNFELIITDDGSSDKSVEIVRSFSDSRIKLINDGKNKGISFRLNQQINLAKGKYFIRMDADDIMFPNRIEKQILMMEKNPNLDLIGTSAVIIDNENNIIGYRQTILPEKLEDALQANVFIHPTICGKLSWFKKFEYKELLDGSEDYDLWIRAWSTSKFSIFIEPLLFYRDPLEFKLATYLDRLKKQRKMMKHNKIFNNYAKIKNKMIVMSYLKGYVARFLHFLGKDQLLISRRNSQLNTSQEYQNILSQIINSKNENM